VSADRDANGFATNVKCDSLGVSKVACASAPFEFLGTQTPSTTGSLSNTLTIGPLRLFALLDFKRGYIEYSTTEVLRCSGAIGVGECRANYFPQEYNVLYEAEATINSLTQNIQDQFFPSGNFVKLREISATYDVPARFRRGLSRTAITIAARELHTWSSWPGLDPEAFLVTDNTVTRSDQAVTPPLMRLIATVNIAW
jgi:hypothetical protein